MHLPIRLLCILAALAAPGLAEPAAPATLRLDYFHTGGRGAAVFALDAVRVEPLPWPGNLQRTVDELGLGNYRYEVRDLHTAKYCQMLGARFVETMAVRSLMAAYGEHLRP